MTALQRLALNELINAIKLASISHAWNFMPEERQHELLRLLPVIQTELDKPEETVES